VDQQVKGVAKAVARALADKLEDLGGEADELDRHLAAMRLRLEDRGSYRDAVAGTLTLLAAIREDVRRGIADPTERRKIIEALGATFHCWKDGPERKCRVELPFGVKVDVHGMKGSGSSGRTKDFHTVQLLSA
jgi:hypothetical protein